MARTFALASNAELRTLGALQLIVFDVDGVMTDGRFTLDADGRESKTFNTQDGYGMRRLLDAGVVVAVITGRDSNAVTVRMQELGVQHVFQGCRDKSATIKQLLNQLECARGAAAAVGDDEPDLAMFSAVATRICVANAVTGVQASADWITEQRGGHGAVREIADIVLAARAQR
ncbi:MAG: KdsC family phosphatase [Gammaproteobacteria bacterium]